MLRLVGLEDVANQFPDQLSGGMQQRVGVARAFAANPEVMLYDEPFSALDPLIRRDMQDEVMRLQQEIGKTTMFITHDLPEALRLGDRIAIMRDGAIVQLGTPEELVGSPADEYVENFTRDIPRSHVLTLRWIMREPGAGDPTDGPRLDVTTTMRKAVPVLAESEKPVCCMEDGRVVGIVDRDAVLRAIAAEERLMYDDHRGRVPSRPSSRTCPGGAGRSSRSAAIVAVMWLAYRGWKPEYPWPNELVWNGLQVEFDDIQAWLIDKRLEGGGGLLFAVFDGFRIFVDNLVTWFNDLLVWLTWIGTTVAGTLLALALRRSACGRLGARRVRVVRRVGAVGGEHGDAGADARRGGAVDPDRVPLGHRRRPLASLQPRADAVPRRGADRPGVRVPDAGRPLLLDRLRRRGGRDDDLRDPALHPDHRARHPPRAGEHRRGGGLDGRDAAGRCS